MGHCITFSDSDHLHTHIIQASVDFHQEAGIPGANVFSGVVSCYELIHRESVGTWTDEDLAGETTEEKQKEQESANEPTTNQ